MVIKKKILYIVLPIITVVILLTAFISYLMGWFGNTPKLDKFQSISEICKVENKLFSLSIKCDVLIYKTEVRDGKNCLDLRVVNKEQTDISELEVCESSEVLDISDPVLDTDMKVPMHMVFKYTYLPPLSYGISNISMELMEDNTIVEVLLELQKMRISIRDVRIQEKTEREEKGYYYKEFKNEEEKNYLGMVTFTETKINNISIQENDLIVGLSLVINRIQSEYEFRENWFGYFNDSSLSEKIKINESNTNILDFNKSYNITFLYIPEESPINKEYFDTNCDVENIMYEVLCMRRDSIEELKLSTDLETYLKGGDLSKLTLDYIY